MSHTVTRSCTFLPCVIVVATSVSSWSLCYARVMQIKQYSAFEVLPGVYVNGNLTIGENGATVLLCAGHRLVSLCVLVGC